MGELFRKIAQKDHILASYHRLREKFFDPTIGLYKDCAVGIDGLDFSDFDRDLDACVSRCLEFLLKRDLPFHPQVLRKVPKDTPGKFREIALLTLRDKVIHRAIADPLAARLDRLFFPNLYSYRKGKYYGAIAAARKVRRLLTENPATLHFFKADIASYFDSMDQQILLRQFAAACPDEPELLDLLEKFVHQPRFSNGVLFSPVRGIPTGSSLSPVCANLYLNELDGRMFRSGHHYLRYGDDLLLLAATKEKLAEGRGILEEMLARHRLSLSSDKTLSGEPGTPFEYLGYRFEKGRVGIGSVPMRRFRQWVYDQLPRDRYREDPNRTTDERRALLRKIVRDLNASTAALLGLKQLPWIRAFPIVDDDRSLREMDRFIKDRIRLAMTRTASRKNHCWVPEGWFRELGYKSLTGAYYRITRRRSLAPYRGWRRFFGENFEAFLEEREKKSSFAKKWRDLKGKIRFVRQALRGETTVAGSTCNAPSECGGSPAPRPALASRRESSRP